MELKLDFYLSTASHLLRSIAFDFHLLDRLKGVQSTAVSSSKAGN